MEKAFIGWMPTFFATTALVCAVFGVAGTAIGKRMDSGSDPGKARANVWRSQFVVGVLFAVALSGPAAYLGSNESPKSHFFADFIGQSDLLAGTLDRVIDGTALVNLSGGDLVGAATAGSFSPRDNVVISIRPERLRILQHDAEITSNRLGGTVAEIVYLGPHRQLIIARPGGDSLLVNAAPDSQVSVGDQVFATCESAHATCLAR